jgi:hemoglobin/transferrin/lactoferrin receptor protein
MILYILLYDSINLNNELIRKTLKNRYFFISKLPLLIFSLISFISFSQSLKLFDSKDMQPISNVYIYNTQKNKTSTTDQWGEANIARFGTNDTLVFQHPAYENASFSYEYIKSVNFIITLNKRTIYLSQAVISANKWEQDRSEIPTKIGAISAEEIEIEEPQTAADILGLSNEVFIQKSQLGGGSPMIRGFATNSVLLVINGVRLNNAIYRAGNVQNVISLDANNIENVEIVFGPGSVIYGSDALGGVMDFHTKDVKLAYINKNNIKFNAFARYSSANNEKTAHFDFNYGKKKWGSYTGITFSGFDDLTMGNSGNSDYTRPEYVDIINGSDSIVNNPDPNKQVYSGYNQFNILQKFRYKPNNIWDLNYAFHFSTTSNIPRYDRLIQYSGDELKYALWEYGPQKWMMNSMQIKYAKSNRFFDAANLTFAFQNLEESRIDRKLNKTDKSTRTEKTNVLTTNIDFEKKFNNTHSFYYGIDINYNNINSSGETSDITSGVSVPSASRYPDGNNNYFTTAAYLSFNSNISEELSLLAGIRYSLISLHSKIDSNYYNLPYDKIDLNTGAFNGSLGFVYRPALNWQINTNLSSGFRAPNLDDIAKVFDSEPGNVVVPNEDLKPEYAYNIDLGIIKSFNDNAKLDMTVFYTHLKDAMVRRDYILNGQDSIFYDGTLSKVEAVVNAASANIYGGSLTLYAKLSKCFSLRSNLTYTYGRDNDDVPLRHVAPFFGSTAIKYETAITEIELYANYNGEKKNSDMAPSEIEKTYMYAIDDNGNPYSPSWWTLNIKSSTKINDKLKVNFGIENLLNRRYRPYSSGIVAPGINIITSLRMSI